MTKKPGSATVTGADRPGPGTGVDDPSAPVPATGPATAPGALCLALVSVAWLALMLWSAQAAIAANGGVMGITLAAYALPGVVAPSLVGGLAVSLLGGNLLTRRGVDHPGVRFAVAVGVGALVGLLAALAVTWTYGDGSAVMVLAGTVAAAAVVGGALGAPRPLVVGAVVAASLAVAVVTQLLNLFQDQLTSFYGSGETQESQLAAFNLFSWTASLASGLAAGLVAYGYLRWAQRRLTAGRPHAEPARWPVYLAGGAGAGLLLLLAELLVRTAGARVLALAGAISEADRTAQGLLGDARIKHGLIVLFLGALLTVLAFGRTLRPAEEPAEEPV